MMSSSGTIESIQEISGIIQSLHVRIDESILRASMPPLPFPLLQSPYSESPNRSHTTTTTPNHTPSETEESMPGFTTLATGSRTEDVELAYEMAMRQDHGEGVYSVDRKLPEAEPRSFGSHVLRSPRLAPVPATSRTRELEKESYSGPIASDPHGDLGMQVQKGDGRKGVFGAILTRCANALHSLCRQV